jgi:hypothetical protein
VQKVSARILAKELSTKVGKGTPLLSANGLLTRIKAAQVPDGSIREKPSFWMLRRLAKMRNVCIESVELSAAVVQDQLT